MATHLVRRERLSILTEDFIPTLEEAERAHKLQRMLTFCAQGIDQLFEQAVRVVREFVDNPRLMRAAGWNSVDEMLLDPDVQGALKIAVTSYEQRRRLLRVAEVDRYVPSVGVLRVEHLTSITTTSRLRRLEELVKEDLGPDEMQAQARNIIYDDLHDAEVEDEPPHEFDGRHIIMDGTPVIRVTARGVLGARLVSALAHLPIRWQVEGAQIVAYDKPGERQVGGELIVDDHQVLAWILRRLHARKALDR